MCVIYASAPVNDLNVGCPRYAHVFETWSPVGALLLTLWKRGEVEAC